MCLLEYNSGCPRKNVGLASVQAEAGKMYYFDAAIKDEETGVTGVPANMGSPALVLVLNLSKLSEDEGKYHVKISALAVSKPQR